MASGNSDYVRGSMPIEDQKKTFSGFVSISEFTTAFLAVVLLMPILVFGAHVSWGPALLVCVILGIATGKLMGLGMGWYTILAALTIFTALLCLFISAVT